MPIRRTAAPQERYPAVVRQTLVQEFLHGDEEGRPANSPLIIIDPSLGNRSRLTVVWDDPQWAALSAEDRSAAILDAYSEANGIDSELDIMFALGLTESEADRIGIR